MTTSTERWSARAYDLHVLTTLFGTSDAVRALVVLTAKAAALMRAWLRIVETLVRRSLLSDALELISMLTKRSRARRAAAARPALRRPSFHLLPPSLGGKRSGARRTRTLPKERERLAPGFPLGSALPDPWRTPAAASAVHLFSEYPSPSAPLHSQQPRSFPQSAPFARRLDALAKVIANPMPYARRLARLLAKKGRSVIQRIRAPLRGDAAKWGNAHIADDGDINPEPSGLNTS